MEHCLRQEWRNPRSYFSWLVGDVLKLVSQRLDDPLLGLSATKAQPEIIIPARLPSRIYRQTNGEYLLIDEHTQLSFHRGLQKAETTVRFYRIDGPVVDQQAGLRKFASYLEKSIYWFTDSQSIYSYDLEALAFGPVKGLPTDLVRSNHEVICLNAEYLILYAFYLNHDPALGEVSHYLLVNHRTGTRQRLPEASYSFLHLGPNYFSYFRAAGYQGSCYFSYLTDPPRPISFLSTFQPKYFSFTSICRPLPGGCYEVLDPWTSQVHRKIPVPDHDQAYFYLYQERIHLILRKHTTYTFYE